MYYLDYSDYWEQQEIALFCMGVDCDTGDMQPEFVNLFPFGC